MPCTLTGSIEGDRALALSELATKNGETITELTQALCQAVAIFRAKKISLPPLVRAFAHKHDKVDAERKAKEKAEKQLKKKIAAAKAKLTDDERFLLGVF